MSFLPFHFFSSLCSREVTAEGGGKLNPLTLDMQEKDFEKHTSFGFISSETEP